MIDQEPVLIGNSAAMRVVIEDINAAARSDAKVLINGETGVGKDVVARLIHHRSARRTGRLTAVNCAGLPDSLLESELFGHARGSFTGAYRDKLGLFETAQGGTAFLDEVGEMSTRMQTVLLRFLETGEIQRVGGDGRTARVNVRIIAATNRDLQPAIAAGTFREDLYYRLNVIRIQVPPLRERRDDIPELLEHFLAEFSRHHRAARRHLSPGALDALVGYNWPGNVREMKNVVERLVVRAPGTRVEVEDLPSDLKRVPVTIAAGSEPSNPRQEAAASAALELYEQMVEQHESFWSVVHAPFMTRDLSREQLRTIVRAGLERTRGNYRALVQLFNMPASDYKRFLSFLRKHGCHVPFYAYRVARPGDAVTAAHAFSTSGLMTAANSSYAGGW
jgi:transcriptional regulator with GAF, ATPase, and Fis domain